MKLPKPKVKNSVFLILIALILIPQTRQPIHVFLHKGLALISPSKVKPDEQLRVFDYDWILKDQNETAFNFKNTKGKVVFINFWATWCPPCIAEMPAMEKLYKDYNSKVEFILVSNESKRVIHDFLSKNDYTIKAYFPVSEYPKAFNITSIPRTFLIDKNGYIVIDKTGAANWNSDSVRQIIDGLLE